MKELLVPFFERWGIVEASQQAMVILGATLLIGIIVRLVIWRTLAGWALKSKTDLDDRLIAAFQNPVSVAILGFGVWHSVAVFQLNEEVTYLIKGILITLVILYWLFAILGFGSFFIERVSEVSERYIVITPRTKPLFHMMFKLIVFLVSFYLVLIAWDKDITAWLASAGVLGVAVGFAAKDTLANFFSGVFIIAEAPYKIGDYVVLDNGDRGRVTDIGIRSTRMMTRDDVEIIVPNAVIGNSTIINQSGGPQETFRIRIDVGVAYGSDLDLVREVLMAAGNEEELVVVEPHHRVRLRQFGESSLNFQLLVWVENPEKRGQATDHLLTYIYKTFMEKGIEIPFPKRDVYLHNVEEQESE